MFTIRKLITRLILALCIPSLIIYPDNATVIHYNETFTLPENYCYNIDEIFQLVDKIEEDNPNSNLSDDEIRKLNEFLVYLARQGNAPEDYVESQLLEYDIEDLLEDEPECTIYDTGNGEYSIFPSSFNGKLKHFQCKNFIKKGWKKTKHFVKKHKKEIIIGAIVVVVITTGYIAVLAAIPVVDDQTTPSSHQEKSGNSDSINIIESANGNEISKEVINENVNDLKSVLREGSINTKDSGFVSSAKNIAARFSHEIADGILGGIASVPASINKFGEICDEYFPSDVFPERSNGELAIERTHNVINKAFGIEEQYKPIERVHNIPYHEAGLPPPTMAPIVPSQANATCGWKVEDCIKNRTKIGDVPKWSSVRARHWKNRAEWAKKNSQDIYTPQDIERMKDGLAPQRINKNTGNIESKELHHNPAQRDGGLFDFEEVWPDEHALIDKNRRIGK